MHIAFRADASFEIGTGHVMRCLALADALKQRGGTIHFVSRGLPEHLRRLVSANGYALTDLGGHASTADTGQDADAQATLAALAGRQWDWLVVDHYALDARWESALRSATTRVMAIDDLADRVHDCDLLLDQNLYADMETRYAGRIPAHCKLMLGPRYALLRDEFRLLRSCVKPRDGRVRRVLVSFGGVDAGNLTMSAIDALSRAAAKATAVDIVIGEQHPRREQIELRCEEQGYICHVQTSRMAELIAAADLGIGAGGSTTWERCCLGLPAIIVPVADNQLASTRYLVETGVAIACEAAFENLGGVMSNQHLLAASSRKAFELVDGAGVERAIQMMESAGA